MTTNAELEALAKALEDSGLYRVLRKIEPRRAAVAPDGFVVRRGLFVDVETTGLDPSKDEIIEIAMVPFSYTLEGLVLDVGEPFQSLRQPSVPIPAEITRMTGIDDAMVAGHSVDPAAVASFASSAALVVAHNASFDRRFLERLCDTFTIKPWACSLSQVDWAAEGFEGSKLTYLAAGLGLFYDRHRALGDCHAGIEVLARPLPISGGTALAQLLTNARKPMRRIWAENSPFELKDSLKARGYRWNPDGNGSPKGWYVDVVQDDLDAELGFLQTEIYQCEIDLLTKEITAFDRFSDRA